MTRDLKEVQILEKSIEELRRTHDEIADSYNRVKTKNFTLIGGGLAFLSFLYGTASGNTLAEKLFIPPEPYGVIFYSMGLISCLVAMCVLFLATKTVIWRIPTEAKVLSKCHEMEYVDFLNYIREEYLEAIEVNTRHHEKKHNYMSLSSFLLLVGAVLLLVVKFFK